MAQCSQVNPAGRRHCNTRIGVFTSISCLNRGSDRNGWSVEPLFYFFILFTIGHFKKFYFHSPTPIPAPPSSKSKNPHRLSLSLFSLQHTWRCFNALRGWWKCLFCFYHLINEKKHWQKYRRRKKDKDPHINTQQQKKTIQRERERGEKKKKNVDLCFKLFKASVPAQRIRTEAKPIFYFC